MPPEPAEPRPGPGPAPAAAGTAAAAAAQADRAARLLQAGEAEPARVLLEDLVARFPQVAPVWNNLASARKSLGDLAGAVAAMRRAVALSPDRAEMHYNLGNALEATGDDGAQAAFRRAVELDPGHSMAWNGLGLALARAVARGPARLAEAGAAYRQALRHDSGNARAWNNLGALFYEENLPHPAIACLREAVSAAPELAIAHNNLANALRDTGRVGEALAAFRTALAMNPDYRDAHTNLIFTLDFDPAQTTASQQQVRRAWAARFADLPALPARPDLAADPAADPGRRLHVGYVSGDFKVHSAAATFAAPILHHDPESFRVTCYYTGEVEDPYTRRFRAAAEGWRQVGALSDQALAEQVRADSVDILVDLSGHTAGHRLGAFARRPAPVQVTGWGHCTGTGMAQMDVLMADPVLVPAAERPLFAEAIHDLPCALGFAPFQDTPPAQPPGGLAAQRPAGQEPRLAVFGALGRGGKAGPDSIRLWAQVLHAVSGSRLYLKDRQYEDRLRAREVALAFAARGIDPSRLQFAGRTDWTGHLCAYWQVDIALDTVPQGGGVTSLEALWMGVPVVSLYGRFPSSRIGAAILAGGGMADLVARDEAGYVAIARRLAAGLDRLRQERAALRERLLTKVPFQPEAYARAVEGAYRTLWRDWCARQAGSAG